MRLFRRLSASLRKRYHMAVDGGFSVGTAYGARFLFDWRNPVDKKVAVGLYERRQIGLLTALAKHYKPEIFLDIGAHAGLYSVLVKTLCPAAAVHAFEPDRTNLSQLRGNLFVNRLDGDVHVHEFALSAADGTARFDSKSRVGRGTRRIAADGDMEIAVRRLDTVLSTTGATVVAKIDVEGHEAQVVAGAQAFLAANRCLLQVETFPENEPALQSGLEGLGYHEFHRDGDVYYANFSVDPKVVKHADDG